MARESSVKFNIGLFTTAIIIACLIVFLIELINPSIIEGYAFSYDRFVANPFVLFTSSLIHAGVTHLVYNLFALVMLGYALEVKTGPKFMVLLYALSVLSGNIAFALFFPEASAVGVSDFVYGIIGALIIIRPKMRVLMPGFITPIPLWLAGPLMGVGEFLLSFTLADGIAHIAHLGGFAAGLVMGSFKKVKISIRH